MPVPANGHRYVHFRSPSNGELYLTALALRTAAGSLRSLAATIVERCR
jgi:hypothetical protein